MPITAPMSCDRADRARGRPRARSSPGELARGRSAARLLGYVSLLGAPIIVATSGGAAALGARVAHGMSRRKLELAFAIFLLLAAVRVRFGFTA